MGGLIGPDLGIGGGYGGGHYEPTYALPPGMNVGGARPINLVLNKNGKPTNHLSSHPATNLANSPMDMNNSENKTTMQKVSWIMENLDSYFVIRIIRGGELVVFFYRELFFIKFTN